MSETETKRVNLPVIAQERLPYHPAVQERFGFDRTAWRALVEAVFPNARTVEAVILVLSYCKARHIDPFKRCVHIVPIWDSKSRREVETVWPGISEHRITAFRTGKYAGRDQTVFGPVKEKTFQDNDGNEFVHSFPEWAEITIHRMVDGQRVAFHGPRVFWLETYASQKSGAPNAMWRKRPYGQLEKCAEAGALRGAFPEELGGELTAEEAEGMNLWHGRPSTDRTQEPNGKTTVDALFSSGQTFTPQTEDRETVPVGEAKQESTPEPIVAPDDSGLLAEYAEKIQESDTLQEVNNVQQHAVANQALTDHTRQQIVEACLTRQGEIRNKRGPRSNGGQLPLGG